MAKQCDKGWVWRELQRARREFEALPASVRRATLPALPSDSALGRIAQAERDDLNRKAR